MLILLVRDRCDTFFLTSFFFARRERDGVPVSAFLFSTSNWIPHYSFGPSTYIYCMSPFPILFSYDVTTCSAFLAIYLDRFGFVHWASEFAAFIYSVSFLLRLGKRESRRETISKRLACSLHLYSILSIHVIHTSHIHPLCINQPPSQDIQSNNSAFHSNICI